MKKKIVLKFQHLQLQDLRTTLLKTKTESYAMALCQKVEIDDLIIIKAKDIHYANHEDYHIKKIAFLKVDSLFASKVIDEAKMREDIDTVIEIHTHPFISDIPQFSSVDDSDEIKFATWISQEVPMLNYGSLVFSKDAYAFRMWYRNQKLYQRPQYGSIKTQTTFEIIKGDMNEAVEHGSEIQDAIYDRSYRVIGRNMIRSIIGNHSITIVGVGGIGSSIAEDLIHMGFQKLNLIDFDQSEISNLNRMVGLTYQDAMDGVLKVDVIKKHLLSINPEVQIKNYVNRIEDEESKNVIAHSDWVILATDNHSSRYVTQKLCFDYYVPFISVGVNIQVKDGMIVDMSGEVITIRIGDKICLKCLKRLDYNEIAKDLSPDHNVRVGLVKKGYVTGADVKEPAVKTLNSLMSSLTVDQLINQYTRQHPFHPILVYENNRIPKIYRDDQSIDMKSKHCDVCDL